MRDFFSEPLFYAAIVAAFLFFNYVTQRLARKAREARDSRAQEAASAVANASDPLDDHGWGHASALPEEVIRARRMPVGHPLPVPTAKRSGRVDAVRLKLRLRGREGLREAVVIMTVLGPCRAQEPYDPSTRDRP